MPKADAANPGRDSSAERGRALVERYARESRARGEETSEEAPAAGDLIADVLAYIASLPDDALPAVYRSDPPSRLAAVAARGVWNALAGLHGDRGDPPPAAIEEACEAFPEYLHLA